MFPHLRTSRAGIANVIRQAQQQSITVDDSDPSILYWGNWKQAGEVPEFDK